MSAVPNSIPVGWRPPMAIAHSNPAHIPCVRLSAPCPGVPEGARFLPVAANPEIAPVLVELLTARAVQQAAFMSRLAQAALADDWMRVAQREGEA